MRNCISKSARENCSATLSKGYRQISIPQEHIPKTAFVMPDGSYEFLKMPFGMINSAATFKRAMKKLLHGLENVEFYWDDILVHTRTWEEHIKALRELFRRLLAAGMTIRPMKCLFGVNTVDFLVHRLEEGLIGLHEDNVTKIKDAPRPTTKRQMRSFMGMAGYYRDFIPNHREHTILLNRERVNKGTKRMNSLPLSPLVISYLTRYLLGKLLPTNPA